jgi:multifunctional 2-oxoglutarate metabolism enzyme
MSDIPPAVLERLAAEFGANSAFVADIYEEYCRDPHEVDARWREYFEQLAPSAVGAPPSAVIRPEAELTSGAPAPEGHAPATLEAPEQDAAAPAPQGRAIVVNRERALSAAILMPGDITMPIRGGILRLVANMEASLLIPTAMSARTIPVRTLEENRRLLNKNRERGSAKVSFAHIVAWAILRAVDTFPRLNDAFAEVDGEAHRVHRDAVRLGIAVDVQRKDGTRTLLVPNIKGANRLTFSDYIRAFEDLVARARAGRLTPDDFLGTTLSYTNPGTVGTTASAPRLMPGQGLIVATGAMEYPAEYRSMPERTLALLGISKVLNISSTYDHRIIQGAESGLFLARIEALLRGEDGFYERIFEELHVPHRPLRWEVDTTPALLGSGPAASEELIEKQAQVLQLIRAFRVRGHLVANLDPLESRRAPHSELDPATYGLTLWDLDREFFTDGLAGKQRASLRETLEVLRETYCGSVAAEYMHIPDTERKEWLQERMESSRNRGQLEPQARLRLLERLVEAASFERFLHRRYLGHKRFSLEGCESLIPMLCRIISDAARKGVAEAAIGMPHRGRLNVLHNVVRKPLAQIFSEFEESRDPDSTQGSGDVKYHLGARGVHETPTGQAIAISVAPNPSHLEFVNPVVEGIARARQDLLSDTERTRVLPILLHGDSAFAGQGIVAETLNLGLLAGYRTGGTIHIVVNNQIGFTTTPEDARSSIYCTDVARMVQAPIFHVNADDPEACLHVAALAVEYRQHFHRDVVIDLVGYRRWGHNEGDEPSYTQPLLYAQIQGHPASAELYAERLVREEVARREDVSALWSSVLDRMQQGTSDAGSLTTIVRRASQSPPAVDAAGMQGRIKAVLEALSSVPAGFSLHPKLSALLKHRADLLAGRGAVDWSTAEALAFGSLLIEGVSVRLSGQDSARGTFSQRHAVLSDVSTGRQYVPLNTVAASGAHFEVRDSSLSEAAVLGFEFGYSVADHRTLVIWEAQFGDFVNAAQVLVDQFIAASEVKWGQPSALTLFLPHGHEGQGPEHSSARVERFLTLCADDNLRIAWPSTPASLFHLLRRQAREPIEKPLVVLTPKSLLRHPRCVSSLMELATGRFLPVRDDDALDSRQVRRIVLTAGKLYFDLVARREQERIPDVALVRLEELYPFPGSFLAQVVERYPAQAEIVWAQEEPQNMGAWRFVQERILAGDVPGVEGYRLRYIGRAPSAAPAPGTRKAHDRQQEEIVRACFE